MQTLPRSLAITKKRAAAFATAAVLAGGAAAVTTATQPADAAANTASHAAVPSTVHYFRAVRPNGKTAYTTACGGWHEIARNLKGDHDVSQCSVRVWMHLNKNHSGKTECFSPHSSGKTINADYHSIQVSSNTHRCP